MEAEEDDEQWEAEWDENERVEHWQPGPEVTLDLYREWRAPRRGTTNPEQVSSPVWEWLVRARVNAFLAAHHFEEPDAGKFGPGWCFTRFGRTKTELPDGRTVMISGEHEDHYDPDFYIYNDVTIRHPDGRLEFFLYPVEDFPPTDFHTATLVDGRIILIGTLGYPEARKRGVTQVLELDLATMRVTAIETSGESPGWIYHHRAELSENGRSISIRGGTVDRGGRLIDNFNDWRLSLTDQTWSQLTDLPWQQWALRRKDGKSHGLFMLRIEAYRREAPSQVRELLKERVHGRESGFVPELDLLTGLYRPDISYETVGQGQESALSGKLEIKVDGVVVRFEETTSEIKLLVEGALSEEAVAAICRSPLSKLARLEAAEWHAVRLDAGREPREGEDGNN